jgi:nucleoside-diphosphate-sugar epimerase
MSRHIVFGTGQVGRHVVAQLHDAGQEVVAVNRSGRQVVDGVPTAAGDVTDATWTAEVTRGADVAYFCLNADDYARWPEQFPPLQRGVLAGARAAGARLVVLDNLYGYGPTGGAPLTEDLPLQATYAKGATRAEMTAELLAAHAQGDVEVAIGRSSDFFGPGARESALGEWVFDNALAGKAAQVMGDLDLPHSYSYTPDVAAALIRLGAEDAAAGQVWHLPVDGAPTTRDVIATTYALAGHRPKQFAGGRASLWAFGLFKPQMREYLATLYQFTQPWIVDDAKYRAAFGDAPTPLDDALAATLDWYRAETLATAC